MTTLSSTRLEALFDYLDGLTGRPDVRELADVLRRTEVSIDDVADWVRFSDRQYARNLIRAGKHYHALALCWKRSAYAFTPVIRVSVSGTNSCAATDVNPADSK